MLIYKKHIILYQIAFMLMVSNFLPVVFINLPPIIRSHHIWTLAWVLAITMYYPELFFKKNVLYVLFYGFLLFISLIMMFHYIDEWNYSLLLNEFYQISIGLSVITYFYTSKNYLHLAKLVKWTLFFLLITAVMTIISSFIDPMFTRNLTGSLALSEVEREATLSIQRYGGGNYSTAMAFMAVIPLGIYYLKNIDKSLLTRWQLIIFLAIIIVALIRMQLFTNILFGFFFGFIAILGVKNLRLSVFLSIFSVIVIMLIPSYFYIISLRAMATLFDMQSDIYAKLNDFATFIDFGTNIFDPSTGISYRGQRYLQLLDSFVESPLLGVFFNSDSNAHGYFRYYRAITSTIGQVEGTHIHWMNKLTTTGIIGLILFLYIPFSHIKSRIKYFSDEYFFYFILASLSILSYGLIKTMAGRDVWYTFFIIIPGVYYLPLLKGKNGKNIS